MNLYDKNGYFNIGAVLKMGLPFNFIWGGRGTGKTYGALTYTLDHKITHMFSRTSQRQVDMLTTPKLFPYKQINIDRFLNITVEAGGDGIPAFYHGIVNDAGKLVPDHTTDPLGYCCALSTIANLRGFDASDVGLWIYDEFVPEKNEKKVIKDVAYAFMNGYETMNRNRELQGKPPLQVVCLSNSESVDCDLFASLGLITKAADMCRKNQNFSILSERGIGLFNLWDSPISQRKSESALYKMVGKDSDFYRMSIENEFYTLDYSDVKSLNIKEFIPVCTVGEITIYEHKNDGSLYVSSHCHGTPEKTFGLDIRSLKAFIREYLWIWDYYLSYDITFENIEVKLLFDRYFKTK